jgi:drug/metabolite transporter (DMT)-like permease
MPPSANNPLRGIWLMTLSMGAFAVADTLIKLASGTISPAQTAFFLTGGGLIVFGAMAIIEGATLFSRAAFSPVMLLRYLAEMTGLLGMVLALSLVPLSAVGAILQATPLVVVAGAVLFLGEKVSWRRWAAIFVGFIGVLLIIQPGGARFDPNALWAVLAMLGLAGRDLTTRLTPPGMASSALATLTMAAIAPFAAGWVTLSGQELIPQGAPWLIIIGMTTIGALGYLLLIASVRTAEVSVVSPFRYTRLIFLLIFGVVIFGERPNALMLLGAAIIIASGIYTMWRDRVTKQAERP